MKIIIEKNNKSATETGRQPAGPSRGRIRQDKFSTLHLRCFLPDIGKKKT
jgi:hypothetical protein